MAYKFKLDIVNPDKHIVTIKPTAGTYAKWTFWSIAPSVVLFGGMALWGALSSKSDDKTIDEMEQQFQDVDPD